MKAQMTVKQTKRIWCGLVDDKFKGEAEYYGAIMDKLKRLKFGYGPELNGFPGKIKPKHSKHRKCQVEDMTCPLCYARKHFDRSLLREFSIKLQSQEIPKRSRRTRLEHHSAKHDQLKLEGGNQLNLFK